MIAQQFQQAHWLLCHVISFFFHVISGTIFPKETFGLKARDFRLMARFPLLLLKGIYIGENFSLNLLYIHAKI